MDKRLNTSFSASNVVTHSIKTGLCGVDLDDAFESSFTSGEFILVKLALWFAFF